MKLKIRVSKSKLAGFGLIAAGAYTAYADSRLTPESVQQILLGLAAIGFRDAIDKGVKALAEGGVDVKLPGSDKPA